MEIYPRILDRLIKVYESNGNLSSNIRSISKFTNRIEIHPRILDRLISLRIEWKSILEYWNLDSRRCLQPRPILSSLCLVWRTRRRRNDRRVNRSTHCAESRRSRVYTCPWRAHRRMRGRVCVNWSHAKPSVHHVRTYVRMYART